MVLWVMVVLGILAMSAAGAARLDLALGAAHRDHAAAIAAAEAGVAEALAAFAADPGRAAGADSLEGALAGGVYRARWAPDPPGLLLRVTGTTGSARRELEVRVEDPAGAPRVAAWREVW